MSKTVQLKRGNANVSATYVGAVGEITVNTTDYTLNIHDGVTPGGYVVTGIAGGNIANINFVNQTISGLQPEVDITINPGNAQVNIQGNVSAEYLLGNGSLITGLSTYSNADVISLLNNYGSPINNSGNITAGYFFGNGSTLSGLNISNIGNLRVNDQNLFGINEPSQALVIGRGDGLGNVFIQGNVLLIDANIRNAQLGNLVVDGTASFGDANMGNLTLGTLNAFRLYSANIVTVGFSNSITGYTFAPNIATVSNTGLLHREQSITDPNVSVLFLSHGNPVAAFFSNQTSELFGNLVITNTDRLHGPFTNVQIGVYSNVNSYSQLVKQNLSEGTLASTDFVATANNGDDATYYVDLGIASNLHIDSEFFGDTTSNNDAYLYVTGYDQAGPSTGNVGNLIIGSTNGVIKFFVGNTAEANVVARITSNALVPGANVLYNLGSQTEQWKDLWVSNNTIYIGGVALGVSADGNLTVNGNTITTGTVTGNITVNLSAINFSANSSGDGNGYSTIQLIPDSTVAGNDQYIIVDPTAPGHIHIRAGGTQDNSYADLILGGENSYFKIAAGANAQAQISANSHNWTFGVDGTFTLPTEAGLNGSQINSVSNSSGDLNGYTTLQLIPDVTLGTGTDQYLIIDPTAPGHIHIRAGGTQDNSSADLILGGEYSHFKIPAGANSTVYIKSNDYNWQFGSDGVTTFPSGVTFPSGGNLIFDSSAISMIDGISTIHFADSSIQTTAYPGTNVSLTLTGNLTVGNLTVNGNATYINTNSYVVDDNIIQMANANPGDTLDIGFAGHRTVASILQHTGLVRDASENTWKLFSNVIPQPGTTVDFTNAIYDDLTVGNLVTNGNITVNDTLIIAGGIQPFGASPAPSLSGFSSISTVISGNPNEGNITAHNYLIANGGIITTGNITGGNLSVTGNISAQYFVGNGSLLTGVDAENSAKIDILNTNGLSTVFYPTFVEDRTNGQILRADVDLTYRTDDNILTVQNISSSGNISATYFIGNGALLTGISGGSGNYGNSNVITLLSSLGSNTIVTSGNVTVGNLITGNGINGYIYLGNAYSRLTQIGSNSYASFDQNIVFVPDTNRSALAGIVIGGNGYLLGPNGARNITLNYGSSGVVGLQANVTVGSSGSGTLTVVGTATTGINAILAGPAFTPLANTSAGFVSSVNSYSQITFQNKSTGADATADYILTADNGSDTVNYGDFGIINSGYDNATPTNSLGNIVYAADTYLYAQGNVGNVSQSGGNLAIGTTVAGKTVKIFAGGANSSSIIATVSNTGMTVTGNISVSGNITGTTPNVNLVAGSYTHTFDNTGNVTIAGSGIRMPSRPAMRVYGNTSTYFGVGTTITGAYFIVDYNQASALNASTGIFTAPVAGLYSVTLVARVGNNNGLNQVAVLKNDSTSGANVICFWETDTSSNTAVHFGTSGVANLAAGDTLRTKVLAGNVQFDSNDSWTVTYIG